MCTSTRDFGFSEKKPNTQMNYWSNASFEQKTLTGPFSGQDRFKVESTYRLLFVWFLIFVCNKNLVFYVVLVYVCVCVYICMCIYISEAFFLVWHFTETCVCHNLNVDFLDCLLFQLPFVIWINKWTSVLKIILAVLQCASFNTFFCFMFFPLKS